MCRAEEIINKDSEMKDKYNKIYVMRGWEIEKGI